MKLFSRKCSLLGLGLTLGCFCHAQMLNVTSLTYAAAAPVAIAVDSGGTLYVVNHFGSSFVEKITPGGSHIWVLESDYSGFLGVAVDKAGNIFVTNGDDDEQNGNTILKLTPTGVVTVLAGTPGQSGSVNGRGTAAKFRDPTGIAVDTKGNLYVTDHKNSTIRKISPTGTVSTFAGLAGGHGNADGAGSAARFFLPTGIAVDGADNVYVLDTGNNLVRKITPSRKVSTIAQLPESSQGLWYPTGIAVHDKDIYVADQFNDVIWHVSPSGVVSTAAGQPGFPGYANGVGTTARFRHPYGIAVDGAGVVLIADTGNEEIRKGISLGGAGPTSGPLLLRTEGRGTVSPNYSNAVLEIGRTYNIKAKASRGFKFTSWVTSTNGSAGVTSSVATLRFVMQSNLTLQANFTDVARPKIAFLSPKSRSRFTNEAVTITGTAIDNSDVASVFYQLNEGEWTSANGADNWTASLTLAPGVNTVRAYAVDATGNISLPKKLRLLFTMPSQTSTPNSP